MFPSSNPQPPTTAIEDDANSGLSYGEASSGEETTTAQDATSATSTAAAPRKRKRQKYQKTSCELCKARKVKCDRAEPACSWCARHKRNCVYLERQKPGSRINFGLELEAKVNKIDALLQSLGRRLEDHIESHSSSELGGHSSGAVVPQEDGGGGRAGGGGLQGQTTNSSSAGASTPHGPSQSGVVWSGSDAPDVSQYGLPVGNHGSNSNNGSFSHPSQPPAVNLSQRPVLGDLPPQDVIYSLVDLYFKHCNTWCPILDRKTTFHVFFGSTSMNEANRVLMHAIVATTLRFFRDSRLSYDAKAHYHAASRRTVQLYAMEHVSIEALKALVILCLDELGTSNGPRGWNTLAMLAQNAKQLGLCEEIRVFLAINSTDAPRTGSERRVITGNPGSWIDDEGRRRLCWMIYHLDRYATIATIDFDFVLSDGLMRRVLPCSYDLFSRNVPVETQILSAVGDHQHRDDGGANYTTTVVNKPENLGSFAYHCEILRIVSRIHSFLRAPIDITSTTAVASWRNTYRSLDASLDTWLQSLPSEYSKISALCHSDPASRVANWFMLHSAYVVAVVRLHSVAAYPTVRSPSFAPSHYAMQRCLSAVHSLGDIARDVYEADGLDLLGPPFAFSLWVAARLLLVHAAATGCAVDHPHIQFLIETLQHVGQYWELARNYAEILTRAVQRERQGVVTLGGMRKTAYDLVNLTCQTRQSGVEQTSTQVASQAELDDIDIFEFFNVPRVENGHDANTTTTGGSINSLVSMLGNGGFSPDPKSDWLSYMPPYT